MMHIKKKLVITHVNDSLYGECLRLNMSIKELLDAVSPDDDNFYQNLEDHGIEFDCPILASPQDVEDYLELEKFDWPKWEESQDCGDESEKKRVERLRSILNNMNGLLYKDVEFIDDKTGKKGLVDPFGNIVVPAIFDSCRGASNMTEIVCYATIEKDGKFYRTPRDGSGKLIDEEGYDKIYFNGAVLRDGNHGKVSLTTPQVLIPCEMDWMEYENLGYCVIFGKNGKLGMRDSYLHIYVSPEYSAYDISTLRFCRDGVWGWISRHTGEFFTEPIGNRYDVMIPACEADSYLVYEDKPKELTKEKEYIPIEGAKRNISDRASEFKKRLKIKLSSLVELSPLQFDKSLVAPPRFVEAIRSLSMRETELCVSAGLSDVPDMHIALFKKGERKVYRLEWHPRNNALAWFDTQLRDRAAFHQLILPEKDTFSLYFYRDFSARQVHIIAKFIVYYYATIWHIPENGLTISFGNSQNS